MAAPSFDATHSIQFDLGRGNVRAGDEQVLLVPASALAHLTTVATPEANETLGRALGAAIGRRARSRLQDIAQDVTQASIEMVVTQLAGEAALAGIGSLSIERWGRAVVVLVEGSPLAHLLMPPLVASALEAIFGRAVWCTLLSNEDPHARVLVASERGIERARDWVAAGMPWGDALTRLQGEPA
jgi:hypothetical protein